MRAARALAGTIAIVAAYGVLAQHMYRWTDENGRTHVTDTPPPPAAKNVQKKVLTSTRNVESGPVPADLLPIMKDFPVVLYTHPACRTPCANARALLNKRGVPFKEVMVWDQNTSDELLNVTGAVTIPALVVGRTAERAFQAEAYNALLDSAHYPKEGVLPPRSQAAPPLPADYVESKGGAAKAEPVKPEPQQPKGPYSPGARPPAQN